MNYQQFVCIIREKVNYLLDSTAHAELHSTLKNNGHERIGLTISHQNTNIFPTIYLEEYYSHYQKGRGINDIAKNIVHLYHEVKFEKDWDIEQVHNFEYAKSKLVYKLIHLEKNQELLKGIPFVPYLDLAIVFYLLLDSSETGSASILISNELQHVWKVDLSDLYSIASLNTPKLLSAELVPMNTVIQELLGYVSAEDFESHDFDENDSHLFVLSNELRHLGAACILYDRVLEDIGNQLNEDFYVLPSSIHETIILPASYHIRDFDLDEMIVEINATQVSAEETLSDHAYYYSRKESKLLQV